MCKWPPVSIRIEINEMKWGASTSNETFLYIDIFLISVKVELMSANIFNIYKNNKFSILISYFGNDFNKF